MLPGRIQSFNETARLLGNEAVLADRFKNDTADAVVADIRDVVGFDPHEETHGGLLDDLHDAIVAESNRLLVGFKTVTRVFGQLASYLYNEFVGKAEDGKPLGRDDDILFDALGTIAKFLSMINERFMISGQSEKLSKAWEPGDRESSVQYFQATKRLHARSWFGEPGAASAPKNRLKQTLKQVRHDEQLERVKSLV